MATIVLSAVGGAAGAAIGGNVLGLSSVVIGRAIGATAGYWIDQQILGVGSEAVETGRVERFRLQGASEGTYRSGPSFYVRPIRKPVAGTVRVGVNGEALVETLHFDVDLATGVIRFRDPPDVGVQVTAGFEFDVPVRFDTDRIQTSVESFHAGDTPNVPILEVRIP